MNDRPPRWRKHVKPKAKKASATPVNGGSIADLYMGINDAAQWLQLSRSTIYAMLDSGELRSIKLRTRRLIERASVAELIEAQR